MLAVAVVQYAARLSAWLAPKRPSYFVRSVFQCVEQSAIETKPSVHSTSICSSPPAPILNDVIEVMPSVVPVAHSPPSLFGVARGEATLPASAFAPQSGPSMPVVPAPFGTATLDEPWLAGVVGAV